ncbi:hypothetical protein AAIG93_33945, partial [Pseudomonas aeruginosa]
EGKTAPNQWIVVDIANDPLSTPHISLCCDPVRPYVSAALPHAVRRAADGYINTNLTANGSVGWQGKNIAASGRTDGNAGVIFDTGLENDGQISAKINGRIFPLNGKRNYLPLSPYGRYEVELQNSKNSLDSYDIVSGRKSHLTLYPGNVAV